jgi:hypothetical protein
MADNIIVQYRFKDDDTGYTDAIVLPYDQFVAEYGSVETPDPQAIDAAKAERIQNYVDRMEEVRNAPPPTADEIAAAAEEEALIFVERLKQLEADRERIVLNLDGGSRTDTRTVLANAIDGVNLDTIIDTTETEITRDRTAEPPPTRER